MIRIAYLLDNLSRGGTEVHAVRLAGSLDRALFDIKVASFSTEGPLRTEYDSLGIDIAHFLPGKIHSLSYAKAGLEFRRWLRQERVDILHSHDIYSNIFGTIWGRLARVPIIITSRRWDKISWASPYLEYLNSAAYYVSTAVLANSNHLAAMLSSRHMAPRDKIHVLHNFLKPEAFQRVPAEESLRWRRALGLPEEALVIGCVARLNPVKDHETLLRAFAMIEAPSAGLHLALVGEGLQRLRLEAMARSLNIDSRVHFLGELGHDVNVNRLFDIATMASRSEGFPNAIIEAMAAGVPVVATNTGGVSEAVLHGHVGLLVPVGDTRRLGESLSQLVHDAILRSEMGRNGRTHVIANFSRDRIVPEYEEWYASLVNGRKAVSG